MNRSPKTLRHPCELSSTFFGAALALGAIGALGMLCSLSGCAAAPPSAEVCALVGVSSSPEALRSVNGLDEGAVGAATESLGGNSLPNGVLFNRLSLNRLSLNRLSLNKLGGNGLGDGGLEGSLEGSEEIDISAAD